MFTPEKIEEWIKEAEERPASAPVIIQFIGNRLRDLMQRNEELVTENIALMTDKRVEEYEQRIAHLEYQLDLLKRQFGGDLSAALEAGADKAALAGSLSLLVYSVEGRVLRLAADLAAAAERPRLGQLQGLNSGSEPPRLLAAAPGDELLLVFSSGRVATLPAGSLPPARPDENGAVDWSKAAIPEEPRAGETLVCVAPITRFALAEYILQASRRGYVKKIRAQMAQSILANHYIGTGVKANTDRTFALALSGKDDRLVLVSQEGYLQCLDVRKLSFSIEEAMRLNPSDHLTAAFPIAGLDAAAESAGAEAGAEGAARSVVVMTQVGKAVHWLESDIETSTSTKVRGQSVFSAQRRGQGVRVIGAAALRAGDWVAALDSGGELALYPAQDLLARGTLPAAGELLAFAAFSGAGKKNSK